VTWTRRVPDGLVAAVVSVTFLAAGCAAASSDGNGEIASTKPAAQILSEAVAKTRGQGYRFTLAYGAALTGEGTKSGAGKSARANMTVATPASGVSVKISALVVEGAVYLKLDFGALGTGVPGLGQVGDKWMRFNASKLSSVINLGLGPGGDTLGAENYVKGVVSAEKAGRTEIRGIVDLARSVPPGTHAVDIAKLSAAAQKVPFAATLDGEGRIVKMVVTMPAVGEFPASELVTTYSDYGTTLDVAKPPAGQVVQAPDMIYQLL
jgi:hypothetical protein